MEKVYVIPRYKMNEMEKKIKRMSAKAKRMGLEEFTMEIIGEEFKTFTFEYNNKFTLAFDVVKVSGEAPQIEGYKIIAMIERANGENIVTRLDEESSVSTEYLASIDTSCNHCNNNRARKYIFVLENENGELMQVGKACLKDYSNSNYSAESIANYYSGLDGLFEFEKVDEGDIIPGGPGWSEVQIPVEHILVYSMYLTDAVGYIPASHIGITTKSQVYNALFEPKKLKKTISLPEFEELREKYKNTIEEMVAYYQGLDGGNEYIHNLKALLSGRTVYWKHAGYLISAYYSYQKTMEKKENEEKARIAEGTKDERESKFVGEVGVRDTFALTYTKTVSYEGAFGTGYMYFFRDKDENVFMWGTNKFLEFEKNEELEIIGTIKEHKEYKDIKQTIITRCKIK